MSAAARVLMGAAAGYARSQLGVTEHPWGSNRVVYWDVVKPSWQGQPWCGAYVTACYLRVGVDLRMVFSSPYYVPAIENTARARGWFKTSNPQRGDLPCYGMPGQLALHVGISEPGPDPLFWAWEGNTNATEYGSQNNGGQVAHRGRPRSWIHGWVDMEKVVDAMLAAGRVEEAASRSKPRTRLDVAQVKTIQRLLGVSADGEWGSSTDWAAITMHRALAEYLGWPDPKRLGYFSRHIMQGILGVTQDGIVGPVTLRALRLWCVRFKLALGVDDMHQVWGAGADAAWWDARQSNLNHF